MAETLYGRNAVREALRARRRTIKQLTVSAGVQETGVVAEIIELATTAGIAIARVERQELDQRLRQINHQGVALEVDEYPYAEISAMVELAEERGEQALVLVLDHLQDPQNVGTLLRTAEVVGVHGVVIPGRRAAEVTPAVVNAASGATEHLRIAVVTNIAQTLSELQKAGLWIVGLEEDERAQSYDAIDYDMPVALVVGAEGPGLARLTRERCDFLAQLPMRGQIASLNAAVAGSIALYHIWRVRKVAS
jgi:23S rRNA (guanosine2251-2'-O)-methyltransferase